VTRKTECMQALRMRSSTRVVHREVLSTLSTLDRDHFHPAHGEEKGDAAVGRLNSAVAVQMV
jgi:hypothetical protein